MFKAEVREMKSNCWQSRWRGVGNDGTGRPTHYIPLTQDEMLRAAATGHVDIPESVIPEVVLAQTARMDELAKEMGFGEIPPNLRNQLAKLALEELAAA